ncbi:hypothetical protein MPSEU_000247800 [Mayamaea pseudoterrestris]|nr:hypothetical protein MPSEU_000247800 [Mayamaea pseudoterrestris]
MSYASIGRNRDKSTSQSMSNHHDTDDTDSDDIVSIRSGLSRKSQLPIELSEPLTNGDSQSQNDPFYVFRSDLYRNLDSVDESLAEYLRVVHQTDTAVNTHQLKESKKQLKRNVKNAEATLKDVHMAVNLVENDRDKFQHISDQELYERRSFVQTSRDRLTRAKQDIQSEAVKAKLLADERAKAIRRAGADRFGASNATQQETTDAIIDSQARTSLLMEHQDETLDVLDEAVGRVHQMAGVIHEEIGQQNKMLTEMEEDLTNVEEELGLVMGKLARFLKTKDTWQLKTILILSVIMIVLLMLVLYS